MLKLSQYNVKLIWGDTVLLDSKALTKIQSIILIITIAVAAVSGAAYLLLSKESNPEKIKIGFLGNLDGAIGKPMWQGAKLAVEEINAEGGILGKQVELIGADCDSGLDSVIVTKELTSLITQHEVDFIVGSSVQAALVQDIIAGHKIIFISSGSAAIPDEIAQRVLDDYDKYKYYFTVAFNYTCVKLGMTDSLIHVRELTGCNKVGYLNVVLAEEFSDALDVFLPENGFELVYKGKFPLSTVDFSSYFAAAEAAGVEVLLPTIMSDIGITFCNEYYDRQSPMIVFGGVNTLASSPDSWEWTDGKCNHMTFSSVPTTAGYPFTSKTLQTRDAYMNRWGEDITWDATNSYDSIKFILINAIERAGSIDTDAVIEALEETSVETSNARDFVFNPSHSSMMGKDPNDRYEDYPIVMGFQWQDGVQVPVDPRKIMEEAGATLTFPNWTGPWDSIE